ncbi:MAG TPA: nucleotidyltransferase family protein [Blastocatellia bacterium]|nr:nucleotidyltransferase family protein [Blastocatellia bacterium]
MKRHAFNSSPRARPEGSQTGRSEIELLICCARAPKDKQTAARIGGLLRQKIDWDCLVRLAHRHGLSQLLYWHLNPDFSQLVPAPALDGLRDNFHATARRNLFLTGELLRLLSIFKKNRVRAIPYKGPVLAASVYRNLALREFADLDILVSVEDVAQAKTLMEGLGYRPGFELTRAQEAAYLRYHCEHLFKHKTDNTLVEIQWGIAPRFFSLELDYEGLWARREPARVAGRQVFTLSPDDLLLVLAIHGGKHLWTTLEWVCGVAETIRAHAERIDWRQVTSHAEKIGAARLFFMGLALARDLLGAELPPEVCRRIDRSAKVTRLAARARATLLSPIDRRAGEVQTALFHLRSRERLADRLRYCLRLTTTPTVGDWQLMPNASLPPFIYLPMRAARLVAKYVPKMIR